MGDKTAISWTDATWNPVRGCSRVSEGCRNCYAERVAARFSDPGQAYHGLARRVLHIANADEHDPDNKSVPRWTGEVRLIAEHLADPLRWKKPRRIFVNSMSDLFHEKLTNEEIAAVFGVMAAAPQHTFQVLTKRAMRMREWFEWVTSDGRATRGDTLGWLNSRARDALPDHHKGFVVGKVGSDWPLPNVWLGVSVENQAAADERSAPLLFAPAAVRFLSCEPLIGPVTLPVVHVFGNAPKPRGIDWVIAGCESGPGARPCSVVWLRSLRAQCAAARVPYFLKQAVEQFSHSTSASVHHIEAGDGSKRKGGGVIELPYLDGVQHAAFPESA